MEKKYSIELDILRDIAMIMVLVCHLSVSIPNETIRNIFVSNGMHGVQIFFVISGYLNIQSYLRSDSLSEYYKKKVGRFFPSYWLALFIAFLVSNYYLKTVPSGASLAKWLRYILGVNAIVPTSEYYWYNLLGFWTISSFVVFYLIIPLVAKYVTSFKKAEILFVISLLVQAVNNIFYKMIGSIFQIDYPQGFIGATPFHEMYMFAIGVMIYWAIQENEQKKFSLELLLFLIIGTLVHKTHYIWAAAAAIYIMNCDVIRCKNIFVYRSIKIISKYSFSIYLVHLMMIQICEKLASDFSLSKSMQAIVLGLMIILGAIVVTELPSCIINKDKRD